MSSITFEASYKQYNLYTGGKNTKGFYTSILDKIHLIFDDALANFARPTIAHIIIDNPKNYRINQVLSRIIANEAHIRGVDIPKFHYISVIEKRRKNSNFHQHLAIIIDQADYYYYELLMLRLRKYSNAGKSTLAKRKHDSRPDFIDPETGEIKKQGSAYLHHLRKETFDAFQRISYIAKVETKASPYFSSSRLLNTVTYERTIQPRLQP